MTVEEALAALKEAVDHEAWMVEDACCGCGSLALRRLSDVIAGLLPETKP